MTLGAQLTGLGPPWEEEPRAQDCAGCCSLTCPHSPLCPAWLLSTTSCGRWHQGKALRRGGHASLESSDGVIPPSCCVCIELVTCSEQARCAPGRGPWTPSLWPVEQQGSLGPGLGASEEPEFLGGSHSKSPFTYLCKGGGGRPQHALALTAGPRPWGKGAGLSAG